MAISKADMTRDEIIRWRFEEKMLVMAENINAQPDLVQTLVDNDQYLRICGEKFMPVSLAKKTPLSGYGNGQCSTLEAALKRFQTTVPDDMEPETLLKKGERRLQSWLIREALRNGRSLNSAFEVPLSEMDDILFGLDEVSMGDNYHKDEDGNGASRCDLLCVGLKNGQWHPLVVELKNLRVGEKLVEQVDTYAKELSRYRESLDPLLEMITGKSVTEAEILKMVIFPEPQTDTINDTIRSTYELFKRQNIVLVEYEETNDYMFSLHSAGTSLKKYSST